MTKPHRTTRRQLVTDTRGGGVIEWLVVIAGMVSIALAAFFILRPASEREARCLDGVMVSGVGQCAGNGGGGGGGGGGDPSPGANPAPGGSPLAAVTRFAVTFGKCAALGEFATEECDGWAGTLGQIGSGL